MYSNNSGLYLASQSPRRAELLRQIAVDFTLLPIDVDETVEDGEDAVCYVQRLAIAKARSGWEQVQQRSLAPLPVMGADTSVVLADSIMGKPRDREHALSMLEALSGQSHRVMSAVCLYYGVRPGVGESETDQDNTLQLTAVDITEVTFRRISRQEQIAYWDSGEPLGKAGAYAIQGRGAVFVEKICGSYSSVVGLPLAQTHALLEQMEKQIAL